MPNLKVHTRIWLIAVLLALLTLFALRPVDPPPLSSEPTSFDGRRALSDLRTVALSFPKRFPGSEADTRLQIWLAERLKDLGMEPHFDAPVPATIDGRRTTIRNLWCVSKGRSPDVILLIANRDSPPLSTQGADDNASGVAALLELARVFSAQAHQTRLVFLWSDGDAFGALGSRAFAEAHRDLRIAAVVALRRVGSAKAEKLALDGWSGTERVAPAWLWALANSAGKAEARLPTPLPTVFSQLVRLAVPMGGGSQAPFVAAGVPALSLSISAESSSPQLDVVKTVSAATLRRVGRAAERIITSLDAATGERAGSGSTVFFSRSRTLPGPAMKLALLFLCAPLALIAIGLLAAAKRRRSSLGPAWLLYLLRLAPWLATLVLVYLANLVSLLPRIPGALITPGSSLAQDPSYLVAFVLLTALVGMAVYSHGLERRFLLRTPVPRETTIAVLHVVLLAVAFLILIVNPFSLLLVLPAAVFWPLARPGSWTRSWLPALAGLSAFIVVLAYYAVALDLGPGVWWYFFLLLENGTIPVTAAILGAAVLAAAVHLAHHLCVPRAAPETRHTAPLLQRGRTTPSTAGDTGTNSGAPRRSRMDDRGAPVG